MSFAYASAAGVLDELRAAIFAPPERLSVSAWAERYRRIVDDDRETPWLNARAPYLAGIMDAFCDPSIRKITVMKAAQVGGTEVIYNCVFWAIDQRPGRMLWVYPNIERARFWNTRRFLPTLRKTPRIHARLGREREDETGLVLQFDRMLILFAGSNAPANTESLPARYGIIDEFDRCMEGTAKRVEKRITTFADGKIIQVGTPELEEVGIDEQYRASDQRRFHVPCPACGTYDSREFENIRWKGGLKADPVDVGQTAWIVCRFCRAEIHAKDNLWQLARGVWCPRGMSVGPDGTLLGPRPRTDHAGFNIVGEDSALAASPSNPYGVVAKAFVEARGKPDQHWYNYDRGVAWTPRGLALEVKHLRTLLGPHRDSTPDRPAETYSLGVVPPAALVLTAAVDIQASGMAYVEVVAWGPYGIDEWLVWQGAVPLPAGRGLDPLAPVLARRYPRLGRMDQTLAPRFVFIDSGDLTLDVYQFCRRDPRRRIPMKGVDGEGMKVPWRRTNLDSYPDGTKMPGGLQLLSFNTWQWSDRVVGRLRARLGELAGDLAGLADGEDLEAESEELAGTPELRDRPRVFWMPSDTGNDYLHQLTAEHKIPRVVRGRKTLAWTPRPGRDDNHYFDCRKMNEAGADHKGIRRLFAPAAESPAAPIATPPPRAARTTLDNPGIAGADYLDRLG